MTLFLTLFPLYLFGNLHCLGMCGPLVMMLSQHRFRLFYFFGRTLSFTLTGAAAGAAGYLLQAGIKAYYIPAAASFFFGALLLYLGLGTLFGFSYPGALWLSQKLAAPNRTLSMLLLRDKPLATFLFGFFTILLPCGQTMIIFSACALAGDAYVGLGNGFAFALITSPSLFLAMQLHSFFPKLKSSYNSVLGISALLVALLAFCRGFAKLDLIPHLALTQYLVLF